MSITKVKYSAWKSSWTIYSGIVPTLTAGLCYLKQTVLPKENQRERRQQEQQSASMRSRHIVLLCVKEAANGSYYLIIIQHSLTISLCTALHCMHCCTSPRSTKVQNAFHLVIKSFLSLSLSHTWLWDLGHMTATAASASAGVHLEHSLQCRCAGRAKAVPTVFYCTLSLLLLLLQDTGMHMQAGYGRFCCLG